ncbi:putative gustatory receptor 28b [Megalopta genalis]|uniref:putative gustatory receptor 28b n=1 Tax=Megalopta genalis TaxID=115081 RepID=UPI003FD093F5
MENMGISMQRSRHYKQQFQIIAVCIVLVLGFVIVSWNTQLRPQLPVHVKLIAALGTNFPVLLIVTSDASFLFWINYLRIKFNQLNNLLHVMVTTTIDSPSDKEIPKLINDFEEETPGQEGVRIVNGNANTMKAVKEIHLQLVKIARIVNDFYGMQLLLTMSTTFVFLTVLLFCAYITIFAGLTIEHFQNQLIMLFVWILFNLSKLFTLSHVCIKTSTEASDTGELVCQLYEPSTSKEFRAEIRDFSLQMVQNPLVFTACGFFYLDESFVQGVIGTISTYLVILIQVSEVNLPEKIVGNTTVPTNVIQMM